jgi:hypothetical protein
MYRQSYRIAMTARYYNMIYKLLGGAFFMIIFAMVLIANNYMLLILR